MSQPSFFVPAPEQKSGHRSPRASLPRETFPQPWVVNLAQHVEPRSVSEGQTLGLMLIGLLVSTAIALALLSGCNPTSGIDQAQTRFEHRDKWPTPDDFNGWRVSGALKCKDFPSLRICEAIFPFFDDGKPVGKDRVTFACSPEDCQWVDP